MDFMMCARQLQAYELRNAGAVIHSHSMYSVLATMLEPDSPEFKVTHIEMIKVHEQQCIACGSWHAQ